MLEKIMSPRNTGFLCEAKKSNSMPLLINGKPIVDGNYVMKAYYTRLRRDSNVNISNVSIMNG